MTDPGSVELVLLLRPARSLPQILTRTLSGALRELLMSPYREEGHSPWAQVVQVVLGFHVDQGDPETDADRERQYITVHC